LGSFFLKNISSFLTVRVFVDVFENYFSFEIKQKTLGLLNFKVPKFDEKEMLGHG